MAHISFINNELEDTGQYYRNSTKETSIHDIVCFNNNKECAIHDIKRSNKGKEHCLPSTNYTRNTKQLRTCIVNNEIVSTFGAEF
jgi:hypothetical protein